MKNIKTTMKDLGIGNESKPVVAFEDGSIKDESGKIISYPSFYAASSLEWIKLFKEVNTNSY